MPKPVSQEFLANLDAMIGEGVALQQQGRLAEAEKIYSRIVKALPDHFDALHLLAELKMKGGKAGEAFRLMNAAIAVNPASADAHVHLGLVLRALKRDADAVASFERALALHPDHIEALGNRGDALLAMRKPSEALECFNRILALEPAHASARMNRGAALAALGRHAEALADFDTALAAMPGQPAALLNRAHALHSLGRDAEALAAYAAVVAIVPQHAEAWNGHGNTLMALNRHPEAVASFEKAIAARPDFADAHFNAALALLAAGDYARGLAAYEWRWKRTGMGPVRHTYNRPLWLGEFTVQRKTILLHAEQGLGDTIQFARYATRLAREGARVVLEVQPELKSLLSRLDGVSQVVARGEALPAFDLHCPLGSLPMVFKTDLATIPADVPYVVASEDRIAAWRARIETLPAPRVAIAWAGNAAHANDRNRSIPAALMQGLWAAWPSHVVSIQRDLRDGDADLLQGTGAPLHVGSELADFSDTAAVLALCDLLITVDTSVAHLAAAMGRPVWILLPFSPDWRWTRDGGGTPWYPTVRLFRQPQLGDWTSVIERVTAELSARFAA